METVIRMKPEYVKAIVDNPALMGLVAQSISKSISTIERWCSSNDERLTMAAVVACVKKFLNLSDEVEVTENVENEAA